MSLPRSTPEKQGVDSQRLLDFYREAEEMKQELHSFMLVKNGFVIGEGWWKPYESWLPHQLFSLSKSFTSTAIGMAVAEGLLSVDDPVMGFFPEEVKALDGRVDTKLEKITVKHLLSMSTGHAYEPWPDNFKPGFVRAFLSGHIKHEPGEVFMYNTNATFMLSAILQKITGQTLTEYLTPRLFAPLGIPVPFWEPCADGIDFGGFGLNLTTEDIAKFGLLYLQKGQWQGKQLLPASWVEAATGKQIETHPDPANNGDWAQGYGYQFWQCRHGAYRGDGAFGQFCVVMPDAQAIIAITSFGDMQATLDLIWKHLYPALAAAVPATDEISGGDGGSEAYQKLLARQKTLTLLGTEAAAPEAARPPEGHLFMNNPRAVYTVKMENIPPENAFTKLGFEYIAARREILLSLWVGKQACPHMFAFQHGKWLDGLNAFPYGAHLSRITTQVDWEASRMAFTIRYPQTPFTVRLDCAWADDGQRLTGKLDMRQGLDQYVLPFEGTRV